MILLKSSLIINGVRVDRLKSRKYNLMVGGSSPATNSLDMLVLMYRIFETRIKILKNYTKRVRSHIDG